jgi:hypothetical protein
MASPNPDVREIPTITIPSADIGEFSGHGRRAAEVAEQVGSQLTDSHSDEGELQGPLPGVPSFSHAALISERIKEKIWSD